MTRLPVFLLLSAFAASLLGCPGPEEDGSASEAGVNDDVWVATGAGPVRVVVGGDTAWVVNYTANSVDAVDLTTCGSEQGSCQSTGTVLLPAGSGPLDATLAGDRLYVVFSNFGFSEVAAIDTTTQQVVATISTGAGALVTPQAVTVVDDTIFIAESNGYGFGPGYVAMVSGTAITGTIASTQLQPVGFAPLPSGDLAVTNLGYVDFGPPVVATSAGGIDVIDPGTGTIVDNIDLGLTAPGSRLAIAGNYGYTASATLGTLLQVNLTTGAVGQIEVSDTDAGYLSWTQAEDGYVFVLSSDEDRVYVFDAATGAPVTLRNGSTFVSVGPGGDTNKGPSHAAVWQDGDGVKHLLVVMALANSVTDVVLDEILPE